MNHDDKAKRLCLLGDTAVGRGRDLMHSGINEPLFPPFGMARGRRDLSRHCHPVDDPRAARAINSPG